MENSVNLRDMTDIKELKALKADNYDLIEQAKRQIEISTNNINHLNLRIEELNKVEVAEEKTPSEE
jgi:hypothetical protein